MSDAAQYAIDIAARMTGGEYTASQLDKLTETLNGAGRRAEHFQQAIAQVSGEFAQATAANTNAQAALSEASAEYGKLERAAVQASKAAERAALKNSGVVPADFQAKVDTANAALSSQVGALKKLEAEAAETQKKEDQLGNTFKNLNKLSGHVDKSLAENAENFGRMKEGLSSLGGTMGPLASKVLAPVKAFKSLSVSMGSSRAAALLAGAGIAALVVVVAAAAIALASATIKIAAWAVSLGDASRNIALSRESFGQLHPALASVTAAFDSVENSTGLAEDALMSLSVSLRTAGVSAADMPAALQAAATAEAALGQGGSAKFIQRIQAGTLSVKTFAATVNKQLGGLVARKMLSLGEQSKRVKNLMLDTFGSLNIDQPLLGLQRMVDLLDANTASGKAVQFLFGKIFQPLIDNADRAAQVVEAFVLGFEIGLVKLYIRLRPVINSVSKLFGMGDSTFEMMLHGITKAAEYLAPVIALVVGGFAAMAAVVGVVIGVIVFSIGLISAAVATVIAMIVAPIYGLIYLIQHWGEVWSSVGAFISGIAGTVGSAISGAFTNAIDFIKSIDWLGLGRNMIMGIVQGITGAAGAVVDAIGGAVSGAINKAKSLLGIHSPSKVFAQMGDYTGQGFVEGVAGQQNAANDTMADLVEPPQTILSKQDSLSGNFGAVASPAPVALAAQQPASGGGGINLAGATFNFYGVEGVEDAENRFSETLTKLIEGDAAAIGGATKAA